MKRLLIFVVSSIMAGAILAEEAAVVKRPRRRQPRPTAGVLECPEAIPSKQIAVFNKQAVLDGGKISAAVEAARKLAGLPLRLDDAKAPAAIDLVADDSARTLTLYPEEFKATLNIKALAADNATEETLQSRVRLELARTAMFLLGSGFASYGCITKPIGSLSELDSLAKETPSAEAVTHLNAQRRLGVKLIRYTTYKQACEQGWAPAPTNDLQRAVWEKVKAERERGPTNPITIPPPKR